MALPTVDEIELLPKWAIAALSARSIRIILPAFQNSSNNIPEVQFSDNWSFKITKVIECGINLVEQAASRARVPQDPAILSGAENILESIRDINNAIERIFSFNNATKYYDISRATKLAIKTASWDSDSNPKEEKAKYSRKIIELLSEGDRQFVSQINSDFLLLKKAAKSQHWSDNTPIPSHFFVVGQDSLNPVLQAIRDLSDKIAIEIAKNPKFLDDIEWRDLERMLALVFENIGFKVELTTSSKAREKDLILECQI